MNILDDYTKEVLTQLVDAKIDFLVVGGYAVNYHGYARTTGDIDLWIRPENAKNKEKLIQVFEKLGVAKAILGQLERLDFTEHVVFSDGIEPFKIDFITRISGVEFADAWKVREIFEIDNIPLSFIRFDHLILSKITSARGKDKVDLEYLQKIQKIKKSKSEKKKK